MEDQLKEAIQINIDLGKKMFGGHQSSPGLYKSETVKQFNGMDTDSPIYKMLQEIYSYAHAAGYRAALEFNTHQMNKVIKGVELHHLERE